MQVLSTQKICYRCQMISISPVDKTLERISILWFLSRGLAHLRLFPLSRAQINQSIIVLASILLLLLAAWLRRLEWSKVTHAPTVKLWLLLRTKRVRGAYWLELSLPLGLLVHRLLRRVLLTHASAHSKLLILLLLLHVAVEELWSEATRPCRLLSRLWLLHLLLLSPHVVHAIVLLLLRPLLCPEASHCIEGVILIRTWCCVWVLIVHTQHTSKVRLGRLLGHCLLLLSIHLLTPSKRTSRLNMLLLKLRLLRLRLPRKIPKAIISLLRGWLEGIKTEVTWRRGVQIDQILVLFLWSQVSCRLWLFDDRLWRSHSFRLFSFRWARSPGRLRVFSITTLRLRKLFLYPFIEFAPLCVEQSHWVGFHVLVNPLSVHILIIQESLDLKCWSIRSWLGVIWWQICLPVGICEIVCERLHELNFAIRPLVQVHRLDLGDVGAELAMLSYKVKMSDKGSFRDGKTLM